MIDVYYHPEELDQELSFTTIKEWVLSACLTPEGKEAIHNRKPSTNQNVIARRLQNVQEWMNLFALEKPPSIPFVSPGEWIDQLETDGYVPEEQNIHRLQQSLLAGYKWQTIFKKHQDLTPNHYEAFAPFTLHKTCLPLVEKIIDEEGKLRPDCDPALQKLANQLHKTEKQVESAFRKALVQARKKATLHGTGESIRNGRRVLAVLSEHKRMIQGVVHDQSESGQVTFIEPSETLHLNNQWIEIQLAYKREIRRILRDLARALQPHVDEIHSLALHLAKADANRAAATVALRLDAVVPKLSKEPEISLRDAKNPHLIKVLQHQKKEVVPLNCTLDSESQVLLISGPNAGGKTVALKTVGLLLMMVQFGWPIPAHKKSVIGCFHKIFTDLGDSQSIDNELSTYSAHLTKMKRFLHDADKHTLILIDELGAGTDPSLGGAMAEAIVRSLLETGAKGVITTHYASLKRLAQKDQRLQNASMYFDPEHLAPTYELIMGQAGSSYTFEMAARSGLSPILIQMAKELAKAEEVSYDKVIQELKDKQAKLKQVEKDMKSKEGKLRRMVQTFEKQQKELEKQREELAHQRSGLEQERNKIVEEKVRSSLTQSANKKGKKGKAEMVKALQEAQEAYRQQIKAKQGAENDEPIGDQEVYIPSLDKVGKIIEEKGANLILEINGQRTTLPKAFVTFREKTKKETTGYKQNTSKAKRSGDVETEFDLRGVTQREAAQLMQSYIDQALLNNVDTLRIIHGRGTGAVQRAVYRVIKQHKNLIADYHFGGENQGGNGVTFIHFR